MRVTIYKAVAATAFAALAAFGTAMADGNLTGPEAIAAAGMALVTGAATYTAPYQVRRR